MNTIKQTGTDDNRGTGDGYTTWYDVDGVAWGVTDSGDVLDADGSPVPAGSNPEMPAALRGELVALTKAPPVAVKFEAGENVSVAPAYQAFGATRAAKFIGLHAAGDMADVDFGSGVCGVMLHRIAKVTDAQGSNGQ